MIKQIECEQHKQEDTEPESGKSVSEEEVSLGELIRRCRAGDEDARMTLRQFMRENPDLFSRLGHITAKVQAEWVRAISGTDLFERELMLKRAGELRKGLIDEGSGSHLERLVVDQVLATHLEQGFHQLIEARCVGKGIELPKYQVDAAQRASKRYEKSLSALTTIRTLAPKMATEPVIEEPAEDKTLEQDKWDLPVCVALAAIFPRQRILVPKSRPNDPNDSAAANLIQRDPK